MPVENIFENLPEGWFQMVIGLIRECIQGTEPRESLESRLRNPGRREFVSLVRGYRREGLRRKQARQQAAMDFRTALDT